MALRKRRYLTFKICYRKRRVNQEGGGHLRKRGDPTLKETMTDKRYKKKQISTILKKKSKNKMINIIFNPNVLLLLSSAKVHFQRKIDFGK